MRCVYYLLCPYEFLYVWMHGHMYARTCGLTCVCVLVYIHVGGEHLCVCVLSCTYQAQSKCQVTSLIAFHFIFLDKYIDDPGGHWYSWQQAPGILLLHSWTEFRDMHLFKKKKKKVDSTDPRFKLMSSWLYIMDLLTSSSTLLVLDISF